MMVAEDNVSLFIGMVAQTKIKLDVSVTTAEEHKVAWNLKID